MVATPPQAFPDDSELETDIRSAANALVEVIAGTILPLRPPAPDRRMAASAIAHGAQLLSAMVKSWEADANIALGALLRQTLEASLLALYCYFDGIEAYRRLVRSDFYLAAKSNELRNMHAEMWPHPKWPELDGEPRPGDYINDDGVQKPVVGADSLSYRTVYNITVDRIQHSGHPNAPALLGSMAFWDQVRSVESHMFAHVSARTLALYTKQTHGLDQTVMPTMHDPMPPDVRVGVALNALQLTSGVVFENHPAILQLVAAIGDADEMVHRVGARYELGKQAKFSRDALVHEAEDIEQLGEGILRILLQSKQVRAQFLAQMDASNQVVPDLMRHLLTDEEARLTMIEILLPGP